MGSSIQTEISFKVNNDNDILKIIDLFREFIKKYLKPSNNDLEKFNKAFKNSHWGEYTLMFFDETREDENIIYERLFFKISDFSFYPYILGAKIDDANCITIGFFIYEELLFDPKNGKYDGFYRENAIEILVDLLINTNNFFNSEIGVFITADSDYTKRLESFIKKDKGFISFEFAILSKKVFIEFYKYIIVDEEITFFDAQNGLVFVYKSYYFGDCTKILKKYI